jgi:hypothetical protein
MNPNKEIELNADLVVAGGGVAGCAAAIAAARMGVDTILIQNRPVLGGNASSEIGILMAGADRDFTHARETGIIEEIDLLNRYHNYEVQWRNCISDATLEALVKSAGVRILLNTHVHSVEMRDETSIKALLAAQQSTEKIFRVKAPLCVDATGDASVAAMAGAIYRTGREGKSEFGESLAPETPSQTTMGSTLMFRVKDLEHPTPFNRMPWAHKFESPDSLPVKIRSLEYPQLWIEYGAELDTIADNMTIREELLKILYGVWDHVKNHGEYNAENLALAWVASVPGKRESRRCVGDYILTQNDLVDSTEFDDAVAYGGWPIDVHNPEGFFSSKKWLDYTHLKKPYQIPYRCYYSKNISNLFFAGRNISASHVAHGSTRLIRTCAVGGQAVGTAAALCLKHSATPRELGLERIEELRQTLLKNDCHIPGVVNKDDRDLAPQASISASSESIDDRTGKINAAEKVTQGVARGWEGDENMWISAPTINENPAWLELRWSSSIVCDTVQVAFDTMIREQRFFDKKVFGPIPTCVKDFNVFVQLASGEWRRVASIKGNFQRFRRLNFERLEISKMKLEIEATNGVPEARIYEIRVYDSKNDGIRQ